MTSPPLEFDNTPNYHPLFKKRFAFSILFLDVFLIHNFLLHFVLGITLTIFHFVIVLGTYLAFVIGLFTIISMTWSKRKPIKKHWFMLSFLIAPLIVQKLPSTPTPQLILIQSGMLYDNTYEFFENGSFKFNSVHPLLLQINYGQYSNENDTLSLSPWPTVIHSPIIKFKPSGNRRFDGYTNHTNSLPQQYIQYLMKDTDP